MFLPRWNFKSPEALNGITGLRRGGSSPRSWLPIRPPLIWSSPHQIRGTGQHAHSAPPMIATRGQPAPLKGSCLSGITILFVNKPLVLRGRGFSKTGALMMAAWSNGRYFISSVGSVAIGRVLVGGAAALARRNYLAEHPEDGLLPVDFSRRTGIGSSIARSVCSARTSRSCNRTICGRRPAYQNA